ncbi:MAG TPA: molybdopterin-dependent oxidoreductase [Chloroflexia bacterium]|nr:molybdopterin-dependent oxidoreductase [Chloroflexia bacterium]
MGDKTHYTTCPLCEATCGLEITTRGREVITIKGDSADVFSKGYICPKAYSLKELDADPDRLRQPLIRRGAEWEKVSWDEAFAEIERNLMPLIQQHGRNAVATYLGNPNTHNLAGLLYVPIFLKALGSRNLFSASTVDQMPKQVAAAMMYGAGLSVAVPDLARTDYLLMFGANPLVSNGSLMTAPDMRGRLRGLLKRGGKVVVIDPVRTRTAEEASEHYAIRPGSDAYLMFGLIHTLFAENLVNPGRLLEHANGLETVAALAKEFSPETVAPVCGLESETIRRLARELAAAPRAAVYGRIGTCTQEFGTIANWLVDVLNFLTGNLDREGGAMFPRAAAGARNTSGLPGTGNGVQFGRWKSRVRGLPELFGELPVATLAEEIEMPGPDQIRALFVIAGNPVLSTPNSARLQRALESLDFMVSIDVYLNETSRHANVILPAMSPLERARYDLAFYQLSVHNVAHYSPPIFEREPGSLDEWEVLLRLSALVSGQGSAVPPAAVDDFAISQMVKREVKYAGSVVEGRDPAELLEALKPRRGPERMLDFMLRTGPYGDAFGANPAGLTLARVESSPHGVDLGPLQPRIPEMLRTPSGKIELAPPPVVEDVARLRAGLQRDHNSMLLIGRRNLRSNNSWMHNLNVLVKGKEACTLLVNPEDAARLNLSDGDTASISSRAGSVSAPVEITAAVMPGVVSLPHGWGHSLPGTGLRVAAEHAGVNSNILADEELLDPLSGNAVLNGIPVTIEKASKPEQVLLAAAES